MSELVRYEAAKAALAVAVSYDEVKDIMDAAERAALYAKQAQDNELIKSATALRIRAQRRAGEMLAQTEKATGVRTIGGGGPSGGSVEAPPETRPTLAEIGITKKQSSTWQALASMTPEHFDAAVEAAKDSAGEVTTAFMVREAKRVAAPKPESKKTKARAGRKPTNKDKERIEELREAKARGVSMLSAYARLTLTALRSQASFTDEEKQAIQELALAIQEVGLSV